MKLNFPNHLPRLTEDDLRIPTLQQNFAWTGREDYLEWVASWKAKLHEKIAEIRRQKAIRRDKNQKDEDRNAANSSRQWLRVQCFNLMLLRAEAKRRSVEQRKQRVDMRS